MEKIRLTKRLAAIAALVPRGARVADVGTDHGYLPAWLAQNGVCAAAVATDIHEGPLKRAARTLRDTGTEDRIALVRRDGLPPRREWEADTVVIAGLGGETIAAILEAAPWTRDGVLLILQPMTKAAELRRRLLADGFCITSESLVEEGRLYALMTARGGGPTPAYTAAEYHTGLYGQISGDPLFGAFLDGEISRLEKAVAGFARAKSGARADRRGAAEALLEAYQDMRERLKHEHGR